MCGSPWIFYAWKFLIWPFYGGLKVEVVKQGIRKSCVRLFFLSNGWKLMNIQSRAIDTTTRTRGIWCRNTLSTYSLTRVSSFRVMEQITVYHNAKKRTKSNILRHWLLLNNWCARYKTNATAWIVVILIFFVFLIIVLTPLNESENIYRIISTEFHIIRIISKYLRPNWNTNNL